MFQSHETLCLTTETKEGIFVLLKNLAKHFRVLYICDIPLCSNDLKVIHSDLTELHIERCPFNFEEQLDLSQLTRLTHFTCSKCYADCHLLFTLKSIPGNLEYLDISGNLLNPIDHAPLVAWIEKQKSLKHLNLSGNNLNPRSAPTLFDILFNLPLLEVLNFKDNYLPFEFLKKLRSFPGTLNWKSLSIYALDGLLKDSDSFLVCFSKLKQLEFLDISDNYEQEFSTSLLKGISELTNLKNIVFNSNSNSAFSNEIENLFRKNPKLSLTLKKHTTKSFKDWKLSVSHRDGNIDESVDNENIENFSQSIYRHLKFSLKSPNNKQFQIENLISKFRGVNGLKLHLAGEGYHFYVENSRNYPPSIEACITYKTESDLKNILSCMSDLKLTFFDFVPVNCYKTEIFNILLETKNSPYWESIEELELSSCDIKIILKIITEINLLNLKTLNLENIYSIDKDAQIVVRPEVKNYFLQKLSLDYLEMKFHDESLRILFKCLPNLTEFKIRIWTNLLDDFSIASLPKGLRSLDIYVGGDIKNLDLFNDSVTLPLLTKFKYEYSFQRYSKLGLKKIIYLPNLTELIVPQWVIKSVTFVVPKLRKLTLNYIYDSSYAYLKKSKNLKIIKLGSAKVGITKKIMDSNFLFSFPNLVKFQCYELDSYGERANFDGVPDEISKSLISLIVSDTNKIDNYYCRNENAKQLQKKNFPFLYMYGPGIME